MNIDRILDLEQQIEALYVELKREATPTAFADPQGFRALLDVWENIAKLDQHMQSLDREI